MKNAQKGKILKKIEPMIIYKITNTESLLTLPPGVPFPMESKLPIKIPKPTLCGISGCTNLKKYNCSKTGVPLCSLDCYKKNLITSV